MIIRLIHGDSVDTANNDLKPNGNTITPEDMINLITYIRFDFIIAKQKTGLLF